MKVNPFVCLILFLFNVSSARNNLNTFGYQRNESPELIQNKIYKTVSEQVESLFSDTISSFGFELKKTKMGIELKWSIGFETHGYDYAIERSSNGLIFSLLDLVSGGSAEDNAHEYTYLDRTPDAGWNYYRIKQQDSEGKYNQSEVKSVYVHTGKSTIVYPTVINDHINISTNQSDIHRFQIVDARGKRIHAGWLYFENSDTRINLPNFSPGVYFISLIADQNIQTFTFIKN